MASLLELFNRSLDNSNQELSMVPEKCPNGMSYNKMQRIFASELKARKYFGNLSGTGTGKTLATLLASRYIDSKITLIICTNNIVTQYEKEILGTWPNDSKVYVISKETFPKLDDMDLKYTHNYFIVNYEKAQLQYSKSFFERLAEYPIDFLVFDEVHLIKRKNFNTSSGRSKLLYNFRNELVKRYNCFVSVLTATPVVNTISEAYSIIELLTGEYQEKSRKESESEALRCENILNGNCIRLVISPKNKWDKELELKSHELDIDVTLDNYSFKNIPIDVYRETVVPKVNYLIEGGFLPKGSTTILYTEYVDGIVSPTLKVLEDAGYKVALFTGEEKTTISELEKSRPDVILASRPIAEGINGLQFFSNRIIFLNLPWTYATYEQALGRVYRNQSVYDSVDVIIPKVYLNGELSIDDYVLRKLRRKHQLSKFCTEGIHEKRERKELILEIRKKLDVINQELSESIEPEMNPLPGLDEIKEKKSYQAREFRLNRLVHRNAHNLGGGYFAELARENKEMFDEYQHDLNVSREADNYPTKRVIQILQTTTGSIADFGCGIPATIEKELTNRKVYSFDVAGEEYGILTGDMKDVSKYLENNSVDNIVYCNSLYGRTKNPEMVEKYLKEGYRVLKCGGTVLLAWPKKVNKRLHADLKLKSVGFSDIQLVWEGKYVIYKAIK